MKVWTYDLYPVLQAVGAAQATHEAEMRARDLIMAQIKKVSRERLGPKETFSRNITVHTGNGKLNVVFRNMITYWREVGTKPHRMTALKGKTVPIRDRVTGEVRFRKVSLRDLMYGKWLHPGTEGKNIIRDIMESVEEIIKEALT